MMISGSVQYGVLFLTQSEALSRPLQVVNLGSFLIQEKAHKQNWKLGWPSHPAMVEHLFCNLRRPHGIGSLFES